MNQLPLFVDEESMVQIPLELGIWNSSLDWEQMELGIWTLILSVILFVNIEIVDVECYREAMGWA